MRCVRGKTHLEPSSVMTSEVKLKKTEKKVYNSKQNIYIYKNDWTKVSCRIRFFVS